MIRVHKLIRDGPHGLLRPSATRDDGGGGRAEVGNMFDMYLAGAIAGRSLREPSDFADVQFERARLG